MKNVEFQALKSNVNSLNELVARLEKEEGVEKLTPEPIEAIAAPDWILIDKYADEKIEIAITVDNMTYSFAYDEDSHGVDSCCYGSSVNNNNYTNAYLQEIAFNELKDGDWFIVSKDSGKIRCKTDNQKMICIHREGAVFLNVLVNNDNIDKVFKIVK